MKKKLVSFIFLVLLPLVSILHWIRHPSVEQKIKSWVEMSKPFKLIFNKNAIEKPLDQTVSVGISPTPLEIDLKNKEISMETSGKISEKIEQLLDFQIPDYDQLIEAIPACRSFFPNVETEFNLCSLPNPFQKIVRFSHKFKTYLEENNLMSDSTRVLLVDEMGDGYLRHVLNFILYPVYVDYQFAPGENKVISTLNSTKKFTHVLVMDTNMNITDQNNKLLDRLSAYAWSESRLEKCWQY